MKETLEDILKKIKSTKLCLMAHPDNEVDSEFADRITDLEEIEIELLKAKSQQGYSEEEVHDIIDNYFEWRFCGNHNIGYEQWFEQFKKL